MGSTRRFRIVTVNIPPNIGAAIRCVTSDPVPLLNIMGSSPAIVEIAVIATGLTRLDVAETIAFCISGNDNRSDDSDRLLAISESMKLKTSTPISAAIPASAMNPTATATDIL